MQIFLWKKTALSGISKCVKLTTSAISSQSLCDTYEDTFEPVVKVPHVEDPALAAGLQPNLLQTVVVLSHLRAVVTWLNKHKDHRH